MQSQRITLSDHTLAMSSAGGGKPGQGYPTAVVPRTLTLQERAGKPGGGKGLLITENKVGALSTTPKQSVLPITVGALCADDYKGINNQYVDQGKCVIDGAGWAENARQRPFQRSDSP